MVSGDGPYSKPVIKVKTPAEGSVLVMMGISFEFNFHLDI